MDIAVLDYSSGRVTIYQGVDLPNNSELIEEFLTEKGHHLDHCHWLSGENLQVDWS